MTAPRWQRATRGRMPVWRLDDIGSVQRIPDEGGWRALLHVHEPVKARHVLGVYPSRTAAMQAVEQEAKS